MRDTAAFFFEIDWSAAFGMYFMLSDVPSDAQVAAEMSDTMEGWGRVQADASEQRVLGKRALGCCKVSLPSDELHSSEEVKHGACAELPLLPFGVHQTTSRFCSAR